MAQSSMDDQLFDDLDTFLNAKNPEDLKKAAATVTKSTVYDTDAGATDRNPGAPGAAGSGAAEPGLPRGNTRVRVGGEPRPEGPKAAAGTGTADGVVARDLKDKVIAIDPALFEGEHDGDAPFVLIPAHIDSYIPTWGWVAIGIGLAMLAAGVMYAPVFSLNRLAARLGDDNEANVRYAMRRLVTNGDDRTVRKLYDLAASPDEALRTRLRAVDAMTLIERVPEVDRALLRLELSESTGARVREAAVTARRQRAAAQAGRRPAWPGGE